MNEYLKYNCDNLFVEKKKKKKEGKILVVESASITHKQGRDWPRSTCEDIYIYM